MKSSTKSLLFLEVLLCFAPVFMLLISGYFLVAVALIKGEFGAWLIFAMVTGGTLGIMGLVPTLINIIDPGTEMRSPAKVKVYLLCGTGAMAFYAFSVADHGWGLVAYFLAPLIAGLHLVFLGRRHLFGAESRLSKQSDIHT